MDKDNKLELARRLVAELEADNEEMASNTLAELTASDSNPGDLFQEVGRLTRELHEAINGFVMDTAMAEMVQVDIPDATERLQYVIETTETAAHQTLTAIEGALPVSERLKSKAEHLNQQWGKFLQREMKVDDFKALSGELSEFLQNTAEDSNELHDKMNEIMMAQGFQDITGQIIKKVIKLVQDVEGRLIHLVKLAGNAHTSKNDEDIRKQKMAEEDGPVVPGVTQSQVVSGQDDVDDLLSSLGF
ncbi:MAG: protein phosphatase CheZ [Gammaproteobacteria bacterium]|nr:protein phosphatase CheZ [Gammaproteobacteria bacterium]NNJ92973.1 protein phosphatase CheZ [Gammaproteobacteria bacterium]